ncbi:type IV pilus modification PilV family protein [Azospirillum griseum]|uniref:Prepilin-type N-terminal cleavage/methylation domain-containing protein n=1 Tax=Azospirillum griseum TaxID=2496639 RepID=A0A3S0ICQ5_9PROT|nr:prepilin-type N-terminal cleavage/methylation domain-containing protein [Azospirillum griseum]RTR16765.1 prepilin-type N-terminal cleavage/methylation domain-containing protein [Azospirillum griseum]
MNGGTAPTPPHPGQRGFSLIEVLAAVAILAIVLGAALRVQRQGLTALDRAEATNRSMLIADSVLAQLTARDTTAGRWSGEQDGARWQATARPLNHSDFNGTTRGGFEPLDIRITVFGADGRRFELRTVQLGRRS